MALTKTPIELSSTPSIVDGGNATAITIDSSEKIGIGTGSPSTLLHLGGTAPGDSIIRQDSTSSGTNWEIGERAAGKWQIFEDDADSIVATFKSDGKVGIGNDSPAQTLSVNASGGANFFVSRTSHTGGLYIESDGTNGVIRNPASNPILFQTNGANTRASVTNDGITFNGDTAAANALDDYEEGTCTMSVTTSGGGASVSLGSATANYTKIGNTVNLAWYSSSSTINAAGSGIMQINGFPFTSANVAAHFIGGITHANTGTNAFWATDESAQFFYINPNATSAYPIKDGAISGVALRAGGSRYIMITCTYQTT